MLLAHRTLPAAALAAAMAKAVSSGVLDSQAVLIDARRQAGRQVAAGDPDRRAGPLRPAGAALDAYDELLTRTIP